MLFYNHIEKFQSIQFRIRQTLPRNKPAVLIVGVSLMIGPGQAQVIREEGVKLIAGILDSDNPAAEWTFTSLGGEILFASLDAHICRESMGGQVTATTAADGGCTDGGGCNGEEGSGLFYIEGESPEGEVMCRADKPAPPPGWQRDPG